MLHYIKSGTVKIMAIGRKPELKFFYDNGGKRKMT